MTAPLTVRNTREACPNYDEAVEHMGERDVDMRSFRQTCGAMLDRLANLGPSESEEVETRRTRLMRSIQGLLDESECGQTMIVTF